MADAAKLTGPRCKCGHLRCFHGANGCEHETIVMRGHTGTKMHCRCKARRKR